MTRLVAALLLLVAACTPPAKPKGGPPSFAEATRGLNAREGLVPTFVGDAEVKVLLPPPGGDGVSLRVIYVASLGAGLGSNPVGLDRGRTSDPVVLAFRVFGDRVLAVAENHAFIADTTDGDEQRAVRESFAESAIWSAKIEARGPRGLLVDLSSLVASDAVGVAERLKEAGQGDFRLDAERSVVDAAATLVFPTNLEAEAIVTFASDNPGSEVDATAPVAGAVTLRMHHSFVKLPDEGYTPRAPDPRMATWSFPYQNYAAPLNESLVREVAIRHRLTTDDEGQVVDPIVFYLDRGTPEPIRSALIEGASWWAEAFEEAGFPGGYRVELLPEGAHPLDARYNIIQWVHRQTRGWSYGNAIWDPRTGEIIKGIVSLGSLRLRHDRRIFEGLLGTAGTGSGAPNDPVELALARVRQLAAHEVGHCLGFPHNMGASQNRRSSVMDYPAPLIRPTSEGALDTSQAYAVGIGDWDKLAVEYLYREVPEGKDPEVFLDGIAARAASEGHTFVTDDHSRPISSAHARGSLWDNGDDPVAMLRETMRVRRIALDRFGPGNLTPGAPQSELRDVLVPVYLYHRYQVDAAAKLLGGYTWRYGVTGKAAPTPVEPVPQERQRAALAALLCPRSRPSG
ncbi:MAG: zinc-dependent metalloprotease [Myxococcota bacterium]